MAQSQTLFNMTADNTNQGSGGRNVPSGHTVRLGGNYEAYVKQVERDAINSTQRLYAYYERLVAQGFTQYQSHLDQQVRLLKVLGGKPELPGTFGLDGKRKKKKG